MPPSPSTRRSPSRETFLRRVNSFGNALPAKPKDEDLTLFADMQKIENDNFLLEPSEDFDESISKLSYFPDVKLGVNIPTRRESHDLLDVDGDKNDYEWLLTPPETPLFRSLDDEEEQSAGQDSRGRTKSKPIRISGSSTVDNTQRSSRSSASPIRLSPSPRSMSRTRPSSAASRSSPPFALQPPTPSWRPSTPPSAKTLTPPRRSPSPASTLTPPRRSPSPASRRMSTGSTPALNRTRGPSPVKTNRISSSPKLQGWHSNVPGFSHDAPANLRTSLPDHPLSHSRGGSPSPPISGRDMGSRGRRQSLSPTPSRRASSSHSIERDRLSSYSKASATSSGEDDLDSMQSLPVAYSTSPAVKKSLSMMKTRTIASSKKPSTTFSTSSVPKRSFDSAVWLMDHRKAPNNMFRPLLSSVPTTTFNAGKGNVVQRPMFSHNSYMTTSSNASSEHSASFGPYVDNDQEQHDQISEWDDNHQVHGDIFMFDKLDELNEETSHEETTKFVESDRQDIDMEKGWAASQTSGTNSSHVGYGEMATCTRCGNVFKVMDVDRQGDYCEECGLLLSICSAGPVTQTLQEAHQQDEITANCKSYAESGTSIASDCVEYREEASLGHQFNDEPPADCIKACSPLQSMVDTNEEMLLAHEVSDNQQASAEHEHFRDQINSHSESLPQCLPELNRQHNDSISQTASGDNYQLGSTAYSSPKVENTDATGISVLLLQKSSSNKWPVVEGRTLSATNILCSEPYYTRDSISAMRRSFGRDSSSATSSIDLGSSRQSDVRFERLRSGKRGDFEKARMSSTMSHQSVASVSDMSISGSSASLCPQSDVIGDTCFPIDTLERSASRTTVSIEEHDSSCMDALSSGMECSSAVQPIINDEILVDLNTSGFHRLSETEDILIKNHNMEMVADNDHLSTNLCLSDIEMPSDALESSAAEESYIPKTEEDTSTKAHCYTISTLEHPSDENNFDDLQMQSEAVQSSNEENKSNGCCTLAVSEDDVLVSGTDTNIKELPNDAESPEAVEGSRKEIQRCFTLEEATDTILLCSSIVHDLAYKAATIALDHEQERVHAEPTRPSVTIVGKSIPKEDGLLKLTHRRTPNRKVKRKRLEGETTITENAEKKDDISTDHSPVRSSSGITRTSESMKPPKLESKCNCIIM
ncbi:uncharacterized protein [Oryza sativa Japonica Group]|uniref:Expressed protein n=1 Tax=Oryza sativa subsp. japonica TaxID=39947 RepID=H2KWP5_ORYSJ|nr:uncharacterized protein LOC4351861 isoform X3 [Oryza sativa Japonica Group]ABG21939.1 expressed protein [Oryza sativa Japonica Group]